MFDLITSAVGSIGSAISGGFQWGLAKLGLNNRASMKDNAVAARDEGTKTKVESDLQDKDDSKIVSDLDPGA